MDLNQLTPLSFHSIFVPGPPAALIQLHLDKLYGDTAYTLWPEPRAPEQAKASPDQSCPYPEFGGKIGFKLVQENEVWMRELGARIQ